MAPSPDNNCPVSEDGPASAAPPSSKGIRAMEDRDAEAFFPGSNDSQPWGSSVYDQQATSRKASR